MLFAPYALHYQLYLFFYFFANPGRQFREEREKFFRKMKDEMMVW
jgi:hypothetical protein